MNGKFRSVIFATTAILLFLGNTPNSKGHCYTNMEGKTEEDMDVCESEVVNVGNAEHEDQKSNCEPSRFADVEMKDVADGHASSQHPHSVGGATVSSDYYHPGDTESLLSEKNKPRHEGLGQVKCVSSKDNQQLSEPPVSPEDVTLSGLKPPVTSEETPPKGKPPIQCTQPDFLSRDGISHTERSAAVNTGSKHKLPTTSELETERNVEVQECSVTRKSDDEHRPKTSDDNPNKHTDHGPVGFDDKDAEKHTFSVEKRPVFPKTLKEFGYYFNEDGELRSSKDGEKFKFVVKENDNSYNQRHYEALGEVITEYVYQLLEERAGLMRVKIPLNAKDGEPEGFFFMSPDVSEKETIMIIIHGSGVVRAGQWTRKLIINNDLNKGTQLPYIEFAKGQGYGVIVLNGNLNRASTGDKMWRMEIRGSESPEDHALYVWDHFIEMLPAKYIAVVAHSYGGIVTTTLSNNRPEFRKRVFAIAFTDSVHGYNLSSKTRHLFAQHAVNWVSSQDPLDTKLYSYGDSKRVSAGHPVHEWTSYAAQESIFKYIKEKYEKRQSQKDSNNC